MRRIGWVVSLLLASGCVTSLRAQDSIDTSLIDVQPAYPIAQLASEFDFARVRADLDALAALPTRLTGTRGNRDAREYLLRRMGEVGLEGVSSESFTVLSPLPDDEDMPASLAIAGSEPLRLEPLWPNMVRASLAPPEGLAGPLVYVGAGELTAYDHKPVDGCIAVMEMDSGRAWYAAAMVGAKAVVFLGDRADPIRGEAEEKFSEQPLSTPRYLALGAAAAALREATANGSTPEARVAGGNRWRDAEGANLYGFIAGTDEKLAGEPIVLNAWYDSMSVAPTAAPGAEGAANCGFLLELCRLLRSHPPARPVIVLFSDAHGLTMAGMRAFVQNRVKPWRVEKPKAADQRQLEPLHFRGMMGFDLSSHGSSVGAFYKGFFYNFNEDARFKFSDFGTACRDYGWLIADALGLKKDASLLDCINTGTTRSWATYLPCGPCLEAECATLAGYAGTSFVTAGDLRRAIDTPGDTLERMDLANLEQQMRVLACAVPNLLCEVLENSDAGLFGADPEDGFALVHGGVFEFGKSISFLPQDPVPGAVACWGRVAKTSCGVRRQIMDQVDDKGAYELVGLPIKTRNWGALTELAAFQVDERTGEVAYAPDRGAQGAKRLTFDNFGIEAVDTGKDIVIFRARQVSVIDTIDPGNLGILSDVRVLDRATKAAPFKWGMIRPSWMDSRLPGDPEPAVVVYGQPGAKLLLLLKPGFAAPRTLLLNATAEEPLGTGIDVDTEPVVANLAFRGARDVWYLDDERIRGFERFGIGDRRAKRLHELAKGTLDEAEGARAEGRISRYVALSRRALAIENRVYPLVEKTARDVVHGVIFYLLLLLPFSYLTERLLLAGRTIGKQVLGAIGIFAVVFALLALVHPAFRITTTPLIVLLAFILMVLAALVAAVIFRHFDQQMEEWRHQSIGEHEADVARLSSSAAAFALGVGNMRRRTTRTGLTCVTLVLLTFTVISFTSVKTEQKVRKLKMDYPASHEGVLIRQPTYGGFSEYTYAVLRNEVGDQFPIVPRSWTLSEGSALKSAIPIRCRGESYEASALLGLSPDEGKVSEFPKALVGASSRWFGSDHADLMTCVLPTRVAEGLGLEESDIGTAEVEVRGVALKVIGFYDGTAADDVLDLDGEMMTPIDEVEQNNLRRQGQLGPPTAMAQDQATTTRTTPHISAAHVVLVPHAMNLRLGGVLRSIAANPGGSEEAQKAQADLVERLDIGVFAGTSGQVFFCSAVGGKSLQGLEGTLVPILIAALIVLNTMLGSVYERVREIGIYSSLGLSPAHVGFLFLAEASVYAVLGAIVGYLIGQGVAWSSVTFGWFTNLVELNYSSLAAVGSTVLVMLVVYLSTLYPARKASDLAVAGVERKWRLPDPQDDTLMVELPFTVQEEESLGLLAYLAEYLDAHADYSVGDFSTDGATLHRLEPGREDRAHYLIRFHAWLSPYDLGVSEECEVLITETAEAGVLGAWARIYRVSGDTGAWIRCTRSFLNLLRRQFLLWRTFAPDEKVRYHQTGQEVAHRGEPGTTG